MHSDCMTLRSSTFSGTLIALIIDVVTRLAMESDWLLEEGWGLFLV